ncbi:MAG: hypothetical protein D4S02_03650 [Rhodocyclaceae bacterium]|nr:MAG: hypothetical protein D4S02_03650 [Rhodocyclaceae bacterium]
MSLLMDALNKAEQAKRQSQAADGRPDGADQVESTSPPLTLELTPLTMPEAPPAIAVTPEPPPALPQLPTHLGVLDEEFIAHATAPKPGVKKKEPPPPVMESRPAPVPEPLPAPKPAPAPARKAEPEEREAAQNLFDAKQGAKPPSRRRLAIAIGVLSLLVGTAIGVYVWLQMQPSGGLGAAGPALAGAPRLPLQQAPAPAPAAAPAEVAAAPTAVAAQAASVAARPANQDSAANGATEPSRPIRLSASRVALNPALVRGYEAYMAGNLGDAQNEYQQVLKTEPANLDALHGMAAISLRQGRATAAEEYYLRAIEADPKDALAHAGLIGLKGKIDPLQSESRLKSLLAAQPDLPYLNFALGNLYASQNRWDEAQSAYFKAYAGEPENPDTLLNLAISLDRLHQSKLAHHYYSLALVAAETRPSSFDKAQVNTRLRELQ